MREYAQKVLILLPKKYNDNGYSKMCVEVKETIDFHKEAQDKENLGKKDIKKEQKPVSLKGALANCKNVVTFLSLATLLVPIISCGKDHVRRPDISPPSQEKEIKVTYDFSAGDKYNPVPVKVNRGDVISIESALPSMICSTNKSGSMICSTDESGKKTICEGGEKRIEFEGFERCELTYSPEYRGDLHDGSIGKCSDYIFGKTPMECPGGEEKCSVIILSKWTREGRKIDGKMETSHEWESKMEEANKRKKRFLDSGGYIGDKEAEKAYDKAVSECKKGHEIDKAVKEEEAFMKSNTNENDSKEEREHVREDYRAAVAAKKDPVEAVKIGKANRKEEAFMKSNTNENDSKEERGHVREDYRAAVAANKDPVEAVKTGKANRKKEAFMKCMKLNTNENDSEEERDYVKEDYWVAVIANKDPVEAVKTGKANRKEEAFMKSNTNENDSKEERDHVREDYKAAVAANKDPVEAVKTGKANREKEAFMKFMKLNTNENDSEKERDYVSEDYWVAVIEKKDPVEAVKRGKARRKEKQESGKYYSFD